MATNLGKAKVPKGVDIERVAKVIDKFDTINLSNLMPIVVDLMQIVAEIPNLRGSEKKALVIDCLKYIVDETDAGSWEKFDGVVKELIPVVIDSLVEANKGKLMFKQIIPKGCCV